MKTPNTPSTTAKSELTDSPRDEERLRGEETTIDMPEVKDIPGQEHVHVLPMGELADTTASSSDEEGDGLLDSLNSEDDDDEEDNDSNVRPDEREALEDTEYMPTQDEDNLREAAMDDTDLDGDPLNERSFGKERTGADLDVPGSEEDDEDEAVGDEDEENNIYSPAQR